MTYCRGIRSISKPSAGADAGVFAALVHDLRPLLRHIADRAPQPSAAIFDVRMLQSSPENDM